MKEKVKNYGHSIRTRLLNVANVTKQPFMKILPRYFQERLLYRLSLSRYKSNFLLKGGALLYAYYNFEARPTVDIDFMGNHINHDLEIIKDVFIEILSINCPEDGVTFDINTIQANEITLDKEYRGVRLGFIARLDTIVLPMSIDIGFGDIVTPFPQKLEYPKLLSLLPTVEVLAYSLETVVAEKFEAMISLGEQNSRMKDFFDVYRILVDSKLNEEDLVLAIKNTFNNRK
ncbi:MAG: nucleotidyl transferase AbiEii/AbiGii toxin family protein, partial [Muribaculaceae bacterium]|nr:nucleotidyl transferase AbiEii/AbiGii toxin family protein [Muribaculaceae bacterium]